MDKGAHFFRCDFQVHTPRDIRWSGTKAVSDEERKQFGKDLIAACRAKGLDAIAITDHHDVVLFPFVKTAAEEEKDDEGNPVAPESRIVVFPGMELTLDVPCQAIFMLDADFPVDFLDQVPVAFAINVAPKDEPNTSPTVRLDFTDFGQLYESLSKHTFLKNRFFVMPHVGEGGKSTLLRDGLGARYATMPCVGGFVDGSLTQHKIGTTSILNGRDKNFGYKAIGLFQTSDNRRGDFEDLGKHTTWVKWAKPTAEALRQACLARESRLSQSEPKIPDIVITAIDISNSSFMGPIDLEFNPQYNAFIGGRGTGKSTVLEYLRWGLCDQPVASDESELPDFQKRTKKLVPNTLAPHSATVSVSFLKNGISHVVRRRTATNDVLLKIGEGDFSSCTEADVRDLLPIQAYSQKQLSSVGVRIEELTRFVQTPIKQELATIESNKTDLRAHIVTAYNNLARYRELESRIAKHDLERRSLSEQLEKLRGDLKGLSVENRAIIDRQAVREQQNALVKVWSGQVAEARRILTSIKVEIAPLPDASPLADTEERALLQRMSSDLISWQKHFDAQIAALKKTLDDTASEYLLPHYKAAMSDWNKLQSAADTAYENAKTQGAAHEGTLRQIESVEQRLRQLDLTVATSRSELQNLGSPLTDFEVRRSELVAAQKGARELVKSQCDKLTQLSKSLIRATLQVGVGSDKVDADLREKLRGSKIQATRYETLWEHVSKAAEPHQEWAKILDELELLGRLTVDDDSPVQLPATPMLEAIGFNARERQAIARQLTPAAWLALFLRDLEDVPSFDYQTRPAEYIQFSVASAGQQATALMYVLLNQEGPPLIIDQPEDDLDNKIMDEIVREIWAAKSRRQLIFSSHNANLVVNGDAELVVCCDYRVSGEQSGGKIKLQGAIDVPEINREITAVMEGGKEAFGLRRAKYGF